MDNIGSQVSAISCLLPLLASLLLALHFIKHPKNPTHSNPPSLHEELSSALFMPDDSEIQLTPVVLTHGKTAVKLNESFRDTWKTEKASANRSETIEMESQILAGCDSGLPKMRLINRAYFSSGKASNGQTQIRKMRPKRSNPQPKGFLPTHLATIIEGLQY